VLDQEDRHALVPDPADAVRQLVGLLVNASTADVTRMEATGDRRLRLAFRLLTFSCVAATIAVAASLWFEGASVIGVWTGDKIVVDVPLLRAFLLYLLLQAPWMTASALALTTNRHRVVAAGYLVSSVVGLTAGAALMGRFGLIAIPAGFLAAEAVVCCHFVIKDACGIAGEPYGAFAARVWLGLALIFVATGFLAWGLHNLELPLFARWAVSGKSCSALVRT
jgi:O-antigen/teichoic acid export membrane protein